MKRKLFLTIGLLIVAILTTAQNKTFEPPKKVNTIVIEKKDTAVQLLLDYATNLQDYGFSIEKVDKDLLTLSTDFKTYKFGGVAVLKIVAFARQNGERTKLEIRGKIEVSNPYGGQVPNDACNCGMAGDARKNAFQELLKTLERFDFETIEFLTK